MEDEAKLAWGEMGHKPKTRDVTRFSVSELGGSPKGLKAVQGPYIIPNDNQAIATPETTA